MLTAGLDLGLATRLAGLRTPERIQDFVSHLRWNHQTDGPTALSVVGVLRQDQAHCIEGAFVAACALWLNGYPPLLIDLGAARGDVDFAYATDFGRFRASVVRQRLGIDIVFRVISTNLRSMDDLGLPESLKLLTQYHNGLVLVTGSVGSGKSTTLAALVDEVNKTRHDHIITLEDPIEYIIESKGCHVTQREVHTHTKSFGAALRGALREDPDVIMVGEMRDLETISLAITASETGHLVLGTLHTGSAARTLDRVLDVFPIDQREQIRIMVSESLRGIVSQQLIPRKDGDGRVLAMEILTNTPAVGNLIREAKTYMLPGVMQTGKKQGMKLMDDSLMELYDNGLISQEEAYVRAEQKALMRQHFAH